MDKKVIQINAVKMMSSIISEVENSNGFLCKGIKRFQIFNMKDDYNYYEIGFKSDLMTFENPWSFCEIGLA